MFSDALTVLTKETISTNHCLQIVLMYKQKKSVSSVFAMKDNDDVLNIKSVQLSCDFGWKRKSDLSLTRHLVRVSSSDDREFVWLHIQSFHVCLVESVLIIRREPHPPALQKKHTHTHTRHLFQIPETVHRYIYFFEWKKKEKTVGFEMLGRRTVPARLRGHDGIYSVKFPTHCSHQSTHTQMPKHTSYSALDPPPPPNPVPPHPPRFWVGLGRSILALGGSQIAISQ